MTPAPNRWHPSSNGFVCGSGPLVDAAVAAGSPNATRTSAPKRTRDRMSVVIPHPTPSDLPVGAANHTPATPIRLPAESAPCLLKHENTRVQGYPWGPGAPERARVEKKPI